MYKWKVTTYELRYSYLKACSVETDFLWLLTKHNLSQMDETNCITLRGDLQFFKIPYSLNS